MEPVIRMAIIFLAVWRFGVRPVFNENSSFEPLSISFDLEKQINALGGEEGTNLSLVI